MERGKASVIVMLTILMLSLFEAYNWSLPFYGVSSASPLVHNINTGLNYTTIQAAIDAPETLDGHTLVCDAGNYTEFVDVYKSLNIIGAGPKVCFVMPPDLDFDDDIDIEVDSVNITGFTIITPGWGTGYFAIFMVGVSKCRIWGNVIIGDGAGIDLKGSSNNIIECNVIKCRDNGIYIRHFSNHNIITNNRLMNNYYGIQVWNSSNYNLIERNFINSSTWCGIRLNWLGSGYLPVEQNTIRDNIVSYCKYGFFLDSPSTSNVVTLNFVSDCSIHGIRLRQSNSSTIAHNTIISNVYGAYLESSYGNLIFDNFFNNTYNAWDNGGNNWNGTKALVIGGYNIIGGIYYGGNYWNNNPNPTDADGDGIGDTSYNIAGGANIDHLPLVTQQPIIMIAYYPFDLDFDLPEVWPECDMIISNGTSIREFVNITHGVTQVPVDATYTFESILTYEQDYSIAYRRFTEIKYRELFRENIHIEPGRMRRFKLVAHHPEKLKKLEQLYVWLKEHGADVKIACAWDPTTLTLNYIINSTAGKIASVFGILDENQDTPPNYVCFKVGIGVCKSEKHIHYPDCMTVDEYDWHIKISLFGSSVSESVTFKEVEPSLGAFGIYDVDYNGYVLQDFNATLTCVTSGTKYSPNYGMPQFVMQPGHYILELTGIPASYVVPKIPLKIEAGRMYSFHVHLIKIDNLQPFSFLIAAESPFSKPTYQNLVHNKTAKTLTLNVSSRLNWAGIFVLPKDRMVKTLIAYSNGTPYQLTKFYNYTENLIGDYNIVCAKIPWEMDYVRLTYTIFGDINGDGKVDIKDVAIASRAFGSYPGHPHWNPVGDINYDLKVDIKDVAAVSKQYGKIDP